MIQVGYTLDEYPLPMTPLAAPMANEYTWVSLAMDRMHGKEEKAA